MRKLILEFDLNEDEYAAMAAIHSLDLARALTHIRERARSILKYDGDPLETLEDIKSIAAAAMEVLE